MNMKLKTCQIENEKTLRDEDKKCQLIRLISQNSDCYGDKLIDFMNIYNLDNLGVATVEQLQEYINTHLQQNLCK